MTYAINSNNTNGAKGSALVAEKLFGTGTNDGTIVGRLGWAQGRTLRLGPSAALRIVSAWRAMAAVSSRVRPATARFTAPRSGETTTEVGVAVRRRRERNDMDGWVRARGRT